MAALPIEIWVNILKFLPFEDVKSCASVCRSIRTAIGLAFPVKDFHIRTFKVRIHAEDLERQPLHFKWINSWFNALHLCDFTDSLLLQLCQTFDHCAYKIHTLILDKCCFSLKNLFCLLSYFPNIKCLRLINYTCPSTASAAEDISHGIDSICFLEIILPAVSVCSVNVISLLLKSSVNLRALSLFSFRFFIDHYMQSTFRDTQMISTSLVINTIRLSASTLSVLKLCETNATDWMIKSIVQTEGLSLAEIYLNSSSELTSDALQYIIAYQPAVKVLELAKCPGISDLRLIVKLKHLRHLNLAKLGVFNAPNWSEMHELEWLSLAHCSFDVLPNIVSLVKLRYLDISGVGQTHRQSYPRAPFAMRPSPYSLEAFVNLREVYLSNCTRVLISPIFDLIHLTVLDLSWNSEVNDSLFLQITPRCVFLQELSLRQDRNLTDTGVTHILSNLPHLSILDLALVDRITDVTLLTVAKHLRMLTDLNISQCSAITRRGVEAILSSCIRLRRLNLALCTALGDDDVLAIPKLNSYLQDLDLSMNPNITEAAVEEVVNKMPFLRSLKTNYCFSTI